MPSGGLPMDVEYEAANLAIRYLRKMAQWNKGLIDLFLVLIHLLA